MVVLDQIVRQKETREKEDQRKAEGTRPATEEEKTDSFQRRCHEKIAEKNEKSSEDGGIEVPHQPLLVIKIESDGQHQFNGIDRNCQKKLPSDQAENQICQDVGDEKGRHEPKRKESNLLKGADHVVDEIVHARLETFRRIKEKVVEGQKEVEKEKRNEIATYFPD